MKTFLIIDPVKDETIYEVQDAINRAAQDNVHIVDLAFMLIDTRDPSILNFCHNRVGELGLELYTEFPKDEFHGIPLSNARGKSLKQAKKQAKKEMKVFLGGTCNESTWRDELIRDLQIEYYNPVVPDWTPACMAEEKLQREKCDFCLYVITPKMTGVYSIAEVIEDSIKRPEKTIFCFIKEETDGKKFTEGQLKSLVKVGAMVTRSGGLFFTELIRIANYLNRFSDGKG